MIRTNIGRTETTTCYSSDNQFQFPTTLFQSSIQYYIIHDYVDLRDVLALVQSSQLMVSWLIWLIFFSIYSCFVFSFSDFRLSPPHNISI